MSHILPGKLYLGNVLNVNRLSWLNQHNIQTIVCVAGRSDVTIHDEIRACKTVHQFEIIDNESQILSFEPILQLIDESLANGGAVLVNCAVGISRSASFVIAYLMKTQKLSLDQAFAFVKRARPKINPNRFFMTQLAAYEQKLRILYTLQ
jgi:protein-tyrosine phosphatase